MKSDINEIVDSLENRISELLHKFDLLKQQSADMENALEEALLVSKFQLKQIQHLEERNASLKNANAILGSDEYKKETKLKINALVKEIDLCVSQLSK